jgi:hypothetical protein
MHTMCIPIDLIILIIFCEEYKLWSSPLSKQQVEI